MVPHNLISFDFLLMGLEHFDKIHNGGLEMCISCEFHSNNIGIPGILQSKLAIDKVVNIIFVIIHNLAQDHVLETVDSSVIVGSTEYSHMYIKGSKAS